jgi:DNA polymerase III epsilon subunit-like protein
MATPLAFIDTETTGWDPLRHEVWEVGLIVQRDGDEHEHLWRWWPNMDTADPNGLRIGRFYDRIHGPAPPWSARYDGSVYYEGDDADEATTSAPHQFAHTLAHYLDGAHLIGAVPSFDAAFLAPLLRRLGQAPTWHYHLIDVEALAAGWLAAGDDWNEGAAASDKCRPPWNSNELSLAVGVDPEKFDRHTALGDARWAKAIYEAVMG